MSVYVLGSINMDLVFDCSRLPNKGETLKAKNFMMTSGGKGANQAVACKKSGIDTYMLGSIGLDPLSKKNKQNLIDYCVNCSYLEELDTETSGIAGIIIENGDNRIITYSGANKSQNVDKIINCIKNNMRAEDILLMQLEIPLDVVELALIEAKKKNITTVLNAAPVTDIPSSFYGNIDILVVNETEFAQITKIRPTSDVLIKEGSKKLIDLGLEKVIVTLGENGSVLVTSNSYLYVPAYKVKVLDTTAAGDTFIGAYLASFLQYKDDQKALKYATAASALTVQTLGAQISIPTREQIGKFIKENGETYE